ncbi:MAG: tRNA pseudouridine(55) synthase TruB [Thermodesulfobacteriota bacterium]|nr:MAG: tRNA pseudouridine(55) synthase TruB [Thermodesulfobacteriota bacterium]
MNGVIVVDKPGGWTSHDVVARVKRSLKAHKVGHLGTLDPVATGVLPLVINGATKFARWLECGKKVYDADLTLGVETDTYDSEGRVTGTSDTSGVKDADIIEAFGGFKGRIKQVPPMYSSVKLSGVPLYKLARKGVTVDRPAKEVEIFSITVKGIRMPQVSFSTVCSRGTYIRSLAMDIGAVLGCGAHLSRLRRTQSGTFSIEEAVSPVETAERLRESLIPLDAALKRASGEFKAITLDDETAARLKYAKRLSLENGDFSTLTSGKQMVTFIHRSSVIAVGESIDIDKGVFDIKRVFVDVNEAAGSRHAS